jgi:hypothetical protein
METLGDSLYSSGQLGTLSSLSILAPLSSEHIAICCLPLFKIKTILGGKSSYNWVPWRHDMHILLCEALHAQFPTFGRFVNSSVDHERQQLLLAMTVMGSLGALIYYCSISYDLHIVFCRATSCDLVSPFSSRLASATRKYLGPESNHQHHFTCQDHSNSCL